MYLTKHVLNLVPLIWELNLSLTHLWFLTGNFAKVFIIEEANLAPLPKT